MTIFHWLGQACFVITTLLGTHILIDPPNPDVGYHIAAHSIPANIVFVSHDHPDHNYVDAAENVGKTAPQVVHPLPLTDGEIIRSQRATYNVGKRRDTVSYKRISAYHDTAHGAQRGQDTITVIVSGGLRIVHMGDIGETALTPIQIQQIGRVDVLMIPVGGFYTVDGSQAAALVSQLKPRVILPMHYGTRALAPTLRSKLATPVLFLAAMKGHADVVTVKARDLALSPKTLPAKPTIYLLRYE